MKETRFALSMMDLGEVPMHTSRPIQKNALQPLYSHGLPPRHSLAAAVTEGTGSQEAPLRTLGLAQTG